MENDIETIVEINKIYQMDCLEYMDKLIEQDVKVDAIITDPPYLINYKTNHRKEKNHDFCSVIKNDDNPELIKDYIKKCYELLKNNSAMYMFCNSNKVDFFKQELEKYFNIKNMIIWVKNNWTAGDLEASFGKQYEIIFLVNKGQCHFNGDRLTDVWKFDRVYNSIQLHQNQKPIKLIKRCILKHTKNNDVVFDGFMGSGTTAVACKELNRNFYGCELEPKYIEIANNRLKNITKDLFCS